jgi:hypothetical protein
MLLRVLGKSVAAGVLAAATLLVGVGGVAAASGGTQLPAPAVQGQPAYWMALKASLDKDTSLSRTVTVVGSLRLLTYTSASGISFVLAEPTGHGSLSVKPDLGVVQCAAWSFCLRLNRTDQGATASGAAAAIAAAACLIPGAGWIGCVAITFAVTVAAFYIASYGICSNQLQIELFPNPGSHAQCV